jgi:hypothetical protein
MINWERLTDMNDRILSFIDWSGSRHESPREPIVPTRESPMRLAFVMDKRIVINAFLPPCAKQAIGLVLVDVLQRSFRRHHSKIVHQDLLKKFINFTIRKKRLSVFTAEQIHKDRVNGCSTGCFVEKFGRL